VGVNERRLLAWVVAVSLTAASCASLRGGSGGGASAQAAAVAYTPPADEPPSDMVLAAATGGPGVQPTPRPAPAADPFREALADAYKSLKSLTEGKNADSIPVLAKVDPSLYGLVIVTVHGAVYEIGGARDELSIQSVSEPFSLARAIETAGPEAVSKRIGVNATGQKFNSILAIDLLKNIPSDEKHVTPAGNPLVDAGAISTVDLLPVARGVDKWSVILGNLEAFAGRKLTVNDEVYKSGSETNTHNRAIVQLLKGYDVIQGDPMEALDLYTRQCSVSVSARDLAVMGATLANGGRNPITGVQVVAPSTAAKVLAVLSTAGLNETTGEWLYKVGVPATSGVGGGIVAVVPGKFAVGTFSPPLDPAGNSVRGQRAVESIVQKLGANVFATKPVGHERETKAEGPPAPVAPPAGVAGKAAPPATVAGKR
jgi:glutaminase